MKQIRPTRKGGKETIRGMVIPGGWDDQFCVNELLIACKGERELRVENVEAFDQLLPLARKEAVVSGIVREVGGREVILVESVVPLGNEENQ